MSTSGLVLKSSFTQSVVSQGRLGGNVACDRSQRLSPGPYSKVISRSRDHLWLCRQLEVPHHVRMDLYLWSLWDRFPRPLNEGLRNKPRLVKLLEPVTSQYCWPVCSFPTFLLGHRKRWILVLYFSRPLSSESESDSFRVSLGKRKCCLPALRRRQQLRPS